MAYNDVRLVVAGVSGEIYMARVLKDGLMSTQRRKATDDCLVAATEWFMQNKKKMLQYEENSKGKKPTLFYTDDPEKAKRILDILEEA